MVKSRRTAPVALVLLAMLAPPGNAAPADAMTLTLPHKLAPDENAWLQVRVGSIRRGQEIDLMTTSGQELGVISPFGVAAGRDAGTYPLPVPPDAFQDGRVSIRIAITQPNGPPRPPTAQEVRGVTLTVTRSARVP